MNSFVALSEQDLFDGLSHASNNVYIFKNNMKTGISQWSDNAIKYFNLPEDYAEKTLEVWLEHIHPDDRESYLADINKVFSGLKSRHYCQYRAKNGNGDYVWVECIGNVIRDKNNNPDYFVGMITRLDIQSKYDNVTKCLSLTQFYQVNVNKTSALILIGMDKFRKFVNNFGYDAGNKMLFMVAETLKSNKNAIVFRMPGDEFLILLVGQTLEYATTYFYECMMKIQQMCIQNGYWEKISFSGGIVEYNNDDTKKEILLQQLEHSLEHAKSLGGYGNLVHFSNEIEAKHIKVQKIKESLSEAIANDFNGFELYFQPIMDSSNKKVASLEALLRFSNSNLGVISPTEFIPILEETREITKVGLWIMEQTIKQKKKWNKKYPDLNICFNVSYLQLYNNDFIQKLFEKVKEYEVNPKNIIVELTETSKVEHPEALANMLHQVLDMGFKVALDDFGMEHSSFELVRDLPVTIIKIDHSFVRTLSTANTHQDKTNLAIISSINYLCKQLGIKVVAEGIETCEIDELICQIGIDYLQGYLYSKPCSAEEIEKLLEKSA